MKYTLYVTENGGYMLSKKAKWYSATEWLGRFGIWWVQVDGVEYKRGVAKNKAQMIEWIEDALPTAVDSSQKRVATFNNLNDVLNALKND